MLSVFKYLLPVSDEVYVAMPEGAKVLKVAEQHNQICVWALVDQDEDVCENRKFRIAGTGHPMKASDDYEYIGSVVNFNGRNLVFHVFEI